MCLLRLVLYRHCHKCRDACVLFALYKYELGSLMRTFFSFLINELKLVFFIECALEFKSLFIEDNLDQSRSYS